MIQGFLPTHRVVCDTRQIFMLVCIRRFSVPWTVAEPSLYDYFTQSWVKERWIHAFHVSKNKIDPNNLGTPVAMSIAPFGPLEHKLLEKQLICFQLLSLA